MCLPYSGFFLRGCSDASSSSLTLNPLGENTGGRFLLGHWNTDGMGCTGGMSVPDVRKEQW